MILFKHLRYKNLLSTGNVFTEIVLNNSKTTLIVGKNGSGKSTILDALTFAFFGKPFREINKPQLLNTITDKGALVEVEFSIGSVEYMIRRGIKPNIFEVYQNGTLLNQSAEMKDYQEILEKQILKLNYKSFCQVIILGSATFLPFMQLSKGSRREIIEDLLDLQIFTVMNSVLKTKILANTEQLNFVTSEQKILEEKLKLIKQHLLEKQNSNDKIIDEKKNLIEETKLEVESLNSKNATLVLELLKLKDSIKDENSVNKKVSQLSQLKHKIEAKTALLFTDIEFFEKHDGCPTCKQEIEESFKLDTLNNKRSEIEQIECGLQELVKQHDELSERLSEILNIRSSITSLTMDQYNIQNKIETLIKYIKQLDKEITSISVAQTVDYSSKMTKLELELKEVTNKYNELIENKQYHAAAASLLKDNGIKAKIIKQYIPIINKLINKYLSSLDFFVQFELDEEFNETIKSRFRDKFSYASFSEGEKMKINLAILFTWRAVAKLRNSASTNLLIMDEVLDSSLDSDATEEFLKILLQLTEDNNTFIISHKTDQISDKFEKILKFEKKQNFSRIA